MEKILLPFICLILLCITAVQVVIFQTKRQNNNYTATRNLSIAIVSGLLCIMLFILIVQNDNIDFNNNPLKNVHYEGKSNATAFNVTQVNGPLTMKAFSRNIKI